LVPLDVAPIVMRDVPMRNVVSDIREAAAFAMFLLVERARVEADQLSETVELRARESESRSKRALAVRRRGST